MGHVAIGKFNWSTSEKIGLADYVGEPGGSHLNSDEMGKCFAEYEYVLYAYVSRMTWCYIFVSVGNLMVESRRDGEA